MAELILIGKDGERHRLDKPLLRVGRDPGCDIVLDDASVSREHAQLAVDARGVTVTDNGARNGTFVDGERLEAKTSRVAAVGSTIAFGQQSLKLTAANTTDVTFDVAALLPQERQLADVMYRAQGALSPAQPIESLYDALMHLSLAFMPGDFAAVHMQEGDVRLGLLRDGTAVTREIVLSTGLRNKVLREKKTILIRDLDSDTEMKNRPSLVNAQVRSAVTAPIFDGDEIMGLLYVTSKDTPLSEIDASTCTVLASVAGTSLLAARMMRDLLEQNEALRQKLRALGVEPE